MPPLTAAADETRERRRSAVTLPHRPRPQDRPDAHPKEMDAGARIDQWLPGGNRGPIAGREEGRVVLEPHGVVVDDARLRHASVEPLAGSARPDVGDTAWAGGFDHASRVLVTVDRGDPALIAP